MMRDDPAAESLWLQAVRSYAQVSAARPNDTQAMCQLALSHVNFGHLALARRTRRRGAGGRPLRRARAAPDRGLECSAPGEATWLRGQGSCGRAATSQEPRCHFEDAAGPHARDRGDPGRHPRGPRRAAPQAPSRSVAVIVRPEERHQEAADCTRGRSAGPRLSYLSSAYEVTPMATLQIAINCKLTNEKLDVSALTVVTTGTEVDLREHQAIHVGRAGHAPRGLAPRERRRADHPARLHRQLGPLLDDRPLACTRTSRRSPGRPAATTQSRRRSSDEGDYVHQRRSRPRPSRTSRSRRRFPSSSASRARTTTSRRDPMRRALLLGNPGDGLRGVDADIATMSALLARYAFTAISPLDRGHPRRDPRRDPRPGRPHRPGDAAVLYYSGHGWRSRSPAIAAATAASASSRASAPPTSRQTTAARLSRHPRRGAHRADRRADRKDSQRHRHPRLLPRHRHRPRRRSAPSAVRATPTPWKLPPPSCVAVAARPGPRRPRRDPETNPLAVRLLACRPHQQAGEDPRAPGGLLTRALAAVLAECDHGELVWEDVGRRVDAWVRAVNRSQNPVVVGPARRYMFSLDTRATTGTTACVTRDDTLWISGGALLDHRPGDRFVALPADRRRPALARLEVTDVHHQLARATPPARCRTAPPCSRSAGPARAPPSRWPRPHAPATRAVRLRSPRRSPRPPGRLTIDPPRRPTTPDDRRGPRRRAANSRPRDPRPRGPRRRRRRGAATLEQTCAVLTRMAQADGPAPPHQRGPSGPGHRRDRVVARRRRAAARRRFEVVPSTAHVTASCAAARSSRCSPPCSPPRPTAGSPC
jgi:hypothetical protein